MKARIVYMTTQNHEEATKIARTLLEAKLAACVNIIEPMTSMYWWQGKITEDQETVLLAKTEVEKIDQIIAEVKKQHSYDIPCILSLPVDQGNPDFLHWIHQQIAP